MAIVNASLLCPCGTKLPYQKCCGLYHQQIEIAPTAEALMRSRYSAFVLKDEGYLLRTWHPDTRPSSIDLKEEVKWIGLKIIAKESGAEKDTNGIVEFIATYKVGGRAYKMVERSHFARTNGHWYYVAGDE